jgi:hypothetical protein
MLVPRDAVREASDPRVADCVRQRKKIVHLGAADGALGGEIGENDATPCATRVALPPSNPLPKASLLVEAIQFDAAEVEP